MKKPVINKQTEAVLSTNMVIRAANEKDAKMVSRHHHSPDCRCEEHPPRNPLLSVLLTLAAVAGIIIAVLLWANTAHAEDVFNGMLGTPKPLQSDWYHAAALTNTANVARPPVEPPPPVPEPSACDYILYTAGALWFYLAVRVLYRRHLERQLRVKQLTEELLKTNDLLRSVMISLHEANPGEKLVNVLALYEKCNMALLRQHRLLKSELEQRARDAIEHFRE